MATGTHAGSTWDTTGSGEAVVATPAVNDLIVIVHGGSGWISGDNSTVADNQGGVYDRFGTATVPHSQQGGTANALFFSVRTTLVASSVSTTYTMTGTGLTGGGLTVLRFSGMTRTGSAAVRQHIGESTQTESPPTITFGSAVLTGNPVILAVMGEDSPLALTSPTGFTEAFDAGWATPTAGVQVCWDDAGNTATLYSWTAGAVIDHNESGFELDTSASAAPYTSLVMSPRGRRP